MPLKTWPPVLAVMLLLTLAGAAAQASTTPAAQLARFSAEAGRAGDAAQGQRLFTTRQGGEWSCASCHHALPTKPGRHAATGKTIDTLAPAFNPASFTDEARVNKWFRRNCKEVFSRECSAAEKADITAWLITLKP